MDKIIRFINGSVEMVFEEQFLNGFIGIAVKIPQGPVQVKENMFIRTQSYSIVGS
jgi:hypothetical protein